MPSPETRKYDDAKRSRSRSPAQPPRNVAVNPATGNLYVSNTDAHNEARFEGPGTYTGHTVQGHLAEARITVISASGVAPGREALMASAALTKIPKGPTGGTSL